MHSGARITPSINGAGKTGPQVVRDVGLIPESGRFPGGEHGKPLQCSCLETRSLVGTGHGVTELDANEASQHTSYTRYKNQLKMH